jgi:hypothetical protein
MKYKVPIVLWFVENNQRTTQGFSKNTINKKRVKKKCILSLFKNKNA